MIRRKELCCKSAGPVVYGSDREKMPLHSAKKSKPRRITKTIGYC